MSASKSQEYIRTFNRFELKYLLHYTQARKLFSMIGAHVYTDQNAGRDGFYKISSLYYDSPDLSAYWEKIDGEKFRRKVRVRTYGEQPDQAFVEIKQRLNLSVQKRRCRVPLSFAQEVMPQICAGHLPAGEIDPVFGEVFILARQNHLRPTLVVSYNRTAYFDRYKRDLRITLDRNIRCRNLSLDLSKDRTRGLYAVAPQYMVLEVKFNEAIPRWLCTCLNNLDLQIVRLSKYCCGIEKMGMERGRSERGGRVVVRPI
jgi:uncharacterized protein YlbG (UPF0298 family)